MTDSNNDREFSRVPVHIVAAATAEATDPVAGRVRDISLNGVFIQTRLPMPVGARCSVLIQLAGLADGPLVRCMGEVIRRDDEGMAIHFVQVIGEDSFEHLKNLVLYNSKEVDRVESEMKGHTGLKRWE